MGKESKEWIMHGLSENDPDCIHTVGEAEIFIEKVGFLPLFKNSVPGFSLEEHTSPDYWWTGDLERDPWEWRQIIARKKKIAYGKFFDKKAGFISGEWIPDFANYRRDGYDFDALWDDQKASLKQKKIMDLFCDENAQKEQFSNEIKQMAGFGKNGAQNFDGTMNALQMEFYLCMVDFCCRKNKEGKEFGWPVAVYATPEHIFGDAVVTGSYAVNPKDSYDRIYNHAMKLFPEADSKALYKLLK